MKLVFLCSRFYDLVNRYLSGEYYGTIMDVNDPNKKVTMFVPSDAAMAKIPVLTLQKLQGNSTKVNEVCALYHSTLTITWLSISACQLNEMCALYHSTLIWLSINV